MLAFLGLQEVIETAIAIAIVRHNNFVSFFAIKLLLSYSKNRIAYFATYYNIIIYELVLKVKKYFAVFYSFLHFCHIIFQRYFKLKIPFVNLYKIVVLFLCKTPTTEILRRVFQVSTYKFLSVVN